MTEFDVVEKPRQYCTHPSGLEAIEVTRLCSFDMGNAIKYIWRYEDKNGLEDLKKARWYLRDLLSSGQARHMPWKSRSVLETVVGYESPGLRHDLFRLLLTGQVSEAIELIDSTVPAS